MNQGGVFQAMYERANYEYRAMSWPDALNQALTLEDEGTGGLRELRLIHPA